DKVAEVSDFIWSTDDTRLIGVVTDAGAPGVKLIDEGHPDAQLYASLASAFDGQMVRFSSFTVDGRKIIVSVYSDRNPCELYLYDRDTGKARFLMKRMPQLDPARMASVKPFSFTARDGMTVHGFLTIPQDRKSTRLNSSHVKISYAV